jgi:anti-sigma B factor antagonist
VSAGTEPATRPAMPGVEQLVLTGELTIHVAADLKPRLLAALEADDTLRLETAGINEVDTAGVQLLLMLAREARVAGKTLELVEPSQALLDVLALAQLGPDLDPLPAPASRAAR